MAEEDDVARRSDGRSPSGAHLELPPVPRLAQQRRERGALTAHDRENTGKLALDHKETLILVLVALRRDGIDNRLSAAEAAHHAIREEALVDSSKDSASMSPACSFARFRGVTDDQRPEPRRVFGSFRQGVRPGPTTAPNAARRVTSNAAGSASL